jgi:YHS domain-containing protein
MKLFFTLLTSVIVISTSVVIAADGKDTGVPANYPLKKCVISGEELGTMGKAFKITHEGTDVFLCCKSCQKDFAKDPAKYVALVKEAAKK